MKKRIVIIGAICMLVLSACGDQTIEVKSSSSASASVKSSETSKASSSEASKEDKSKESKSEANNKSSKNSAVFDSLKKKIEDAEKKDTELKKAYETGKGMTVAAADRYKLWDDLLNELWDSCKTLKDDASQKKILEEQRAWIKEKDAKVSEAGKEFKGGSEETRQKNDLAADLTRDRVYALYKTYSGQSI